MFRKVPLSIIRAFHCTHSNDICHTGLLTACEQDQDRTNSVLILLTSCVYSEKLLIMDRGTVQKYVELYSKNKFEKLVHLVILLQE